MSKTMAHLIIWHWDNTSTVLHLDEDTSWRTDPNDGIIYKTDGHAASRSIWPWSSIKSYEVSIDSEAEQDEDDNTENIGTALHEMFEHMAGGDVAMFRYDPSTGTRTAVDPEEALNLASLITNTMTDIQQHEKDLKHELECAIKEFGSLEDYQQTFRDLSDTYGKGIADNWREVFLAQNGDIDKANQAVLEAMDVRREKNAYIREQEQQAEKNRKKFADEEARKIQQNLEAYRESKRKADRGETVPRQFDVNASALRAQGHKVDTVNLPQEDQSPSQVLNAGHISLPEQKDQNPSVEEVQKYLHDNPWEPGQDVPEGWEFGLRSPRKEPEPFVPERNYTVTATPPPEDWNDPNKQEGNDGGETLPAQEDSADSRSE